MKATESTSTQVEVITEPQQPQVTEEVIERDEFCNPDFIDPNAKLPRLQALRGTNKTNFGYFISSDQMAIAGWLEDNPNLTTYEFESSGQEEQGLLLKQPRMLVMPPLVAS